MRILARTATFTALALFGLAGVAYAQGGGSGGGSVSIVGAGEDCAVAGAGG